MSIRTRITLVGVGIVMLVICCLSTTLFALISRGLDTDRDTALSARVTELAVGLQEAEAAAFAPATVLAQIDPRSSVDIFTIVLAADGTPLQYTGRG